MPTQEEVLEAIKELGGVVDYKGLKEYFKITLDGNSNLPQRVRSLQKRDKVFVVKLGNRTVIVDKDLKITEEEAIELLLRVGNKKRRRGRKKGYIIYDEIKMLALLKYVREMKFVTAWEVRKRFRWNEKTVDKYLNKLVRQQQLYKIFIAGRVFFTTKQLI